MNFALSRRIVSSVSRESFMQNIGARNNAVRARDVSVHTTGDLRIHGAKIVLYIKLITRCRECLRARECINLALSVIKSYRLNIQRWTSLFVRNLLRICLSIKPVIIGWLRHEIHVDFKYGSMPCDGRYLYTDFPNTFSITWADNIKVWVYSSTRLIHSPMFLWRWEWLLNKMRARPRVS